MFDLSVSFKATGREREEIISLLRSMIGPTLACLGCVACECYENVTEEAALLFREQWRSREHFEDHARSELFLRLLSAMDLAAERPVVRCTTASAEEGMEAITAAREKGLKQ